MKPSLDVGRMSDRGLWKRLDSNLYELETRLTGSPGRKPTVVIAEVRLIVSELRLRGTQLTLGDV
jgi:hypothetical protein